MTKPLLLVDIDGVLIPFVQGENYVKVDDSIETIWLAEHNTAALLRIQEDSEIVWASWWEGESNDLAHLMDVGPYRFIDFSSAVMLGAETTKLPPVMAFVDDRPFAWIDDDLRQDTFEWAAERCEGGIPTLMVRTDPAVGATEDDWCSIEAFLASLR